MGRAQAHADRTGAVSDTLARRRRLLFVCGAGLGRRGPGARERGRDRGRDGLAQLRLPLQQHGGRVLAQAADRAGAVRLDLDLRTGALARHAHADLIAAPFGCRARARLVLRRWGRAHHLGAQLHEIAREHLEFERGDAAALDDLAPALQAAPVENALQVARGRQEWGDIVAARGTHHASPRWVSGRSAGRWLGSRASMPALLLPSPSPSPSFSSAPSTPMRTRRGIRRHSRLGNRNSAR